jgi:hypothetical protein
MSNDDERNAVAASVILEGILGATFPLWAWGAHHRFGPLVATSMYAMGLGIVSVSMFAAAFSHCGL